MTELRIGFIGLGNMGGRMTKAITKTGRAVLGFDVVTDNIVGQRRQTRRLGRRGHRRQRHRAALPAGVEDRRAGRARRRRCARARPRRADRRRPQHRVTGVHAGDRRATGRQGRELSRRRHLRWRRSRRQGGAHADGGRRRGHPGAGTPGAGLLLRRDLLHGRERQRPCHQAAQQLSQRDQPDHHRRGDGGRQEGGPGPGEAARGDQPQLGRELRVAEPFSEDRHRRLPRRRPDLGPDAQGRAALHRVRRIARRGEPQLVGADRGVRAGRAAGLRAADQQPGRGRDRRRLRWRAPARSRADPDNAKEQTK